MRNEQHGKYGAPELAERVRVSISIKRNRTLDKKRRSELRYNTKETETEIIISNTYKTRETIIYKRLSRRSTS